MRGDGPIQALPNQRLGIRWTGALLQRKLPVPARDTFSVAAPLECVSRLELADVEEGGCRGGDVSHLEKRVQRFPVERARRQVCGVQCLELGCERDSPGCGEHV